MNPKRSNLIIDGEKDQETLNFTENETLNSTENETQNHPMLLSQNNGDDEEPLTKRKIKIEINERKALEKPLKRPISAAPIPPSRTPKPVFDSESDSDDDGDQERSPTLAPEIHESLAAEIPERYKKLMTFMGAPANPKPRLVAERRLTKGDVDARRNRLLIPGRKVRFNFLDVEEEECLNRNKWWPVEVIEPDCTVSVVTLSKWATKKGPAYVFVTEWMGLVERNELQEGDMMQLWSFRAAGKGKRGRICFLLLEIDCEC